MILFSGSPASRRGGIRRCCRPRLVQRQQASLIVACCFLLFLFLSVTETGAQQAPAYVIPNFSNDTSLIKRQNVCDRYRMYDSGEVELRLALQGLELTPVFVTSTFFRLDDETQRIQETNPGLQAVLMDELAQRAGFTWRDSFGLAQRIQPNSNHTWTDLLEWATDYYDVFVARFDKTLNRLKFGISFPEGYYDSSYILVGVAQDSSSRDSASIDLWQWLEPFDTEVWICIVVTILVSGILYQILDHIPQSRKERQYYYQMYEHKPTFNEYRKQKQSSEKRLSTASNDMDAHSQGAGKGKRKSNSDAMYEGAHTMGESIFLSSLLFTQHFQFMPRTPSSRVFSASMGLWALLISSNYTANLASFFVIENTPTLTVQSLDDAIKAGYPICLWKDTAPAEYMKTTYPQAIFVEVPGTEEQFYATIRSGQVCSVAVTSVATFERSKNQKALNPNCNLLLVGRVIKFVPAGFGVKADSGNRCSSLIHDVLNLHLVEMEADGFTEAARKADLKKVEDQNCDATSNTNADENNNNSNSRSLKEMAGTFLIHLVFAVVALVVMAVTRLFDWYKQMSEETRRDVISHISGRISRIPVGGGGGGASIPGDGKNRAYLPEAQEEEEESHQDNDHYYNNPHQHQQSQYHSEEEIQFESKDNHLEEVLRRQDEMEQKLDTLVQLLQKQQQLLPENDQNLQAEQKMQPKVGFVAGNDTMGGIEAAQESC